MKWFSACLAVGLIVLLARAGNPGPVWTMDLEKMKFADGLAAGKLLGVDFKTESVQLHNTGTLVLRSGKDAIVISLSVKPGQGIEGKTYKFGADGKEVGRPTISVHIHSTSPPGVALYTTGYALRLEFGKAKEGKIPGQLYLCLPDERKSCVAGNFALVLGSVSLPVERSVPPSGTELAPKANEFAPRNQMFVITMPVAEKIRQRMLILAIGRHKVPIEARESVSADGTSFVGASIGIPALVMRDIPAEQRFDVLRDALVKRLKGKVTSEKDVKQDPIVGKEYQIQLPRAVARLQLYTVAGFVVYAVVEGRTAEQITSKQADAFFQSLRFTDKAKEVFREVQR